MFPILPLNRGPLPLTPRPTPRHSAPLTRQLQILIRRITAPKLGFILRLARLLRPEHATQGARYGSCNGQSGHRAQGRHAAHDDDECLFKTGVEDGQGGAVLYIGGGRIGLLRGDAA